MKILKFKKDKKNIYELFFDDDTSTFFYDDVIIKYNLLTNKELDENKFEEIFLYNSFLEHYYNSELGLTEDEFFEKCYEEGEWLLKEYLVLGAIGFKENIASDKENIDIDTFIEDGYIFLENQNK